MPGSSPSKAKNGNGSKNSKGRKAFATPKSRQRKEVPETGFSSSKSQEQNPARPHRNKRNNSEKDYTARLTSHNQISSRYNLRSRISSSNSEKNQETRSSGKEDMEIINTEESAPIPILIPIKQEREESTSSSRLDSHLDPRMIDDPTEVGPDIIVKRENETELSSVIDVVKVEIPDLNATDNDAFMQQFILGENSRDGDADDRETESHVENVAGQKRSLPEAASDNHERMKRSKLQVMKDPQNVSSASSSVVPVEAVASIQDHPGSSVGLPSSPRRFTLDHLIPDHGPTSLSATVPFHAARSLAVPDTRKEASFKTRGSFTELKSSKLPLVVTFWNMWTLLKIVPQVPKHLPPPCQPSTSRRVGEISDVVEYVDMKSNVGHSDMSTGTTMVLTENRESNSTMVGLKSKQMEMSETNKTNEEKRFKRPVLVDEKKKKAEKRLFRVVNEPNPSLQRIENLINQGVDINCRDMKGNTPLLTLCSSNNNDVQDLLEIVRLFVKTGVDVHAKDQSGYNALNLICDRHCHEKNFIGLIRLLIEKGTDINATNGSGDNALFLICYNYRKENFIDVIRLFIEHGAYINEKVSYGSNALHIICYNYHEKNLIDVIRLFIENGADINATNGSRDNALHIICKFCKKNLIDVIRFFIENGADINGNASFNVLETICLYYREKNLVDVIRFLIENGADVKIKKGGESMLNYLVFNHCNVNLIEVVRLLIEKGVDMKAIISNTQLRYYLRFHYKRADKKKILHLLGL